MLPPGTIACARCGKHLPSIATFCDGCGARVAEFAGASTGAAPLIAHAAPVATARPGFVAAGRGMSICHQCGAIAPTRRSSCEVCDTPIGTSLEAIPARDDGAYWVQVRTELVCRQCGQRSPLDPLESDPTVSCGRCGTVQAFDATAWDGALAHAHAVGDLGGPDLHGKNLSVGAKNPFAELGVTRAAAEHLESGMTITGGVMRTRNVAITAAPGHPLCSRCGCPIEIEARGNEVVSRCKSCGEAARYRFPVEVMAMAPGLVTAIGDELRIDRPAAQLDATSAGAVIAVKCPSCGGGLELEGGKHFAICRYCHTHCRIPQRTLLALHRDGGRPDPWWALFRGPSPMRSHLLAEGTAFPSTASREDDDEDEERPRRRKKSKKLAMIEQPETKRSPQGEVVAWALQITLPLLMVAIVGAVLHGNTIVKWVQGIASHEVLVNAPPR